MSGLARLLFVLSYILSKEGCPYSVEEEATAVSSPPGPPDGATALMTFMKAVTVSGLARLLFVLSYILSKEGSVPC